MSFISMPKLALVPLEGDMKGIPVITMYNPTELNFKKEIKFEDEKGKGEDVPSKIRYSGGNPINLNLSFFFDFYEKKFDVRPAVMAIMHMGEAQECSDDKGHSDKRPPRVQFVWKDTNPLGTGAYCAVLTSVDVTYTMFLDDGTPCRAKVTVSCSQVDPLEGADKFSKATSVVIMTAGLTAAAIENMGGRGEIESGGGKIEDPSTWPATIEVKV
jgi:hypothetical protein